jgi:hypothetical protein
MTLRSWIAWLAAGSTLMIAGVALAQQPSSQASDVKDRGTGVSMTNPIGLDGKPLTQSTNFGSR